MKIVVEDLMITTTGGLMITTTGGLMITTTGGLMITTGKTQQELYLAANLGRLPIDLL